MPGGVVWDPHVFVSIAPDGTVTIVTHRSEMGTGLAHQPAHGGRGRNGSRLVARSRSSRRPATSRSTATRTPTARAASATSSSRCAPAAPPHGRCWSRRRRSPGAFPDTECRAREPQGHPHARPARQLGYGELAAIAAKLKTPERRRRSTLKDPSQFRYIGKGEVQIIDLRDITMGKADLRPGHPRPRHEVRRGRASAGRARQAVKSFDEAAAMKVPGVIKVVKIKSDPDAGQVRAAGWRGGHRRTAPGPR